MVKDKPKADGGGLEIVWKQFVYVIIIVKIWYCIFLVHSVEQCKWYKKLAVLAVTDQE